MSVPACICSTAQLASGSHVPSCQYPAWASENAALFSGPRPQVSNRGGESTAPEQTADGKPLTKLGDRGGRAGADGVVSDAGSVLTTESVVSGTATPTTHLHRLREVARASLAGRTVRVRHQYPMPISDPGAFEGEHTKFVVIEPSLLLALLDVADAAADFVGDGRLVGGPMKAALARLDEVAP